MNNPRLFRLILVLLFVWPVTSWAATCDQYPGDTWLFGGMTSTIKPNVLIIIDTSGSMQDTIPATATSFSPTTVYPTVSNACRSSSGSRTNCSSSKIYKQDSRGNWVDTGFSLSSVTASCNGVNPYYTLSNFGQYNGRTLTSAGRCSSSGTAVYATGNWVNWDQGATANVEKISVARDVVRNLISSTTGVNFGVMLYNNGGSSNQTSSLVQSQGARFFSYAVSGTSYTSTVKDMDAIFSGTMTNRDALLASINSSTVVSQGYTPLAESLYEAGRYFSGGASAFGNTFGLSGTPLKYTSPIVASCQKNYIVFITDGMSTSDDDPVLKTVCPSTRLNCQGDYDGDGIEPTDMSHSFDDVAKYLYDSDLLPDDTAVGKEYTIGKQRVSTYTVGFGIDGANAAAVDLLQRASDDGHGHGASFSADSQSTLITALNSIMGEVLEADTSFVAPVVPVSPDNRTYSSNRVYMGFFVPVNQSYWKGNLKKYGLDANLNIVDKNGNPATWVDGDSNNVDDVTGTSLPTGASNGNFRSSSVSYWSSAADAGNVDSGGVGDLLLLRDFSANPRKLYTYTGTNSALTHASNAFSKSNAAITATTLNVADAAAKDDLIDFTNGIDVYNGSATDKRDWILGDILHSKPLAVNYATYDTSLASNEGNCSVNKTIIYVGSNDGMLHAFKDCDGSEAWAFIPKDVLGNLKEIPGTVHSYFIDSSPSVYMYDQNKNGNIEAASDKVILMVGLRRGGGPNTAPAKGYYYALDVTDPAAPQYLWSVSNATSDFSELGESWGEPKIAKLKIGGATKIAAFVAGGYDNLNEDSRFGHTQTFSGTATVSNSVSGGGNVTSSGTSSQLSPRGRGIYALEIATIGSNGVPTVATAPNRIWGVVFGATTSYTTAPATDADMSYSFVSELTTLDVDGNGYIDRLYAVDLGGNLWRFDVGNASVASWRGNRIFKANPGSGGISDTGRKMFYKPVATLEATTTSSTRGNDALIFVGSGDREHPLNTAVVDRLYAIRDKGQLSTSAKSEADLLDVTTDQLQAASGSQSTIDATVSGILATLGSASNYGWYIKLDQVAGEKVLSPPTLSNKIVYFTTYSPGASANNDPCKPNMGTGRLYVLNYATGEAVMNYDTTNDTTVTTNKRAKSNGKVIVRSDRVKTIGSGPPSQIILLKDKYVTSVGSGIVKGDVKPGGRIINLYWGQK